MSVALTKQLFTAILHSNEKLALQCLDQGAYITRTIRQGNVSKVSALHLAADRGLTKIVEALIEAGHSIDEADSNGLTPLLNAANKGHLEIIELLKNKDAKLSAKTIHGRNALHLAIQCGSIPCVKYLLQCQPELLLLSDDFGETILHIAAIYKQKEVLTYLFDHYDLQSLLNTADMCGDYPLHQLITSKFDETFLNKLIENGANPRVVNSCDRTPAQLATLYKLEPQANALREKELPLFYLCCKTIVNNASLYDQVKKGDFVVPEEVKSCLENVKNEMDIVAKLGGLKL